MLSPDKITVPLPDFDDIEVDVIDPPYPDSADDTPTWNPEEILDGIKLVPPTGGSR